MSARIPGALALLAILVASPVTAQTVDRPELLEPVTVIRDADGIAHIDAQNVHDLFFMQGWVHAEDRMFQMDYTRRIAEGTLAELLGPAALSTDVQLRTFGLRRAAKATLPNLTVKTREALFAYTEGVNAWIDENPPPPEYGFPLINRSKIRAWKTVDTVAIAKLIAFQLSFDDDTGLTEDLTAYFETLGEQGQALFFADVFRSQPFDCAAAIPDATNTVPYVPVPGGPFADDRCEAAGPTAAPVEAAAPVVAAPAKVAAGSMAAMRTLTGRVAAQLRRSEFLAEIIDADSHIGSNEFGVTAALGANGLPVTANDPHLALDTPSTFYPNHLKRPGFNVWGSSFPGVPLIVHGRNRWVHWGSTVNPMDVTDWFVELVQFDETGTPAATIFQGQPEPITIIPEEFRANLFGDIVVVPPGDCTLDGCEGLTIPPATFVVPRRNGGPLVMFFQDQADPETGLVPAISIQYTGFGVTREIDAFRLLTEARNVNQFRDGLQYFDVGSQNWIVGDQNGNLAYFTSAELPLRADLQAGTVAPGSIPGFFPPGVPIPPWFVRDGTSGDHEWLAVQNEQYRQTLPYEILPFDEMPQVINPVNNWYVNANNDPAGTSLDNDPLNQLRPGFNGIYYLNPGYASGFRAGAITLALTEAIDEDGVITVEDLQAIQGNVSLTDARYFVPWITQAWANANTGGVAPELAAFAADERLAEAADRLATWDFTTPTGLQEGHDFGDDPDNLPEPDEVEIANSVAATIYSVWRGQAVRAIIDETLDGLGLPTPGSSQAMTAMRNLLDNFDARQGFGASGINFFELEGVANPADARDIKLLGALQAALDLLAGPDFAPAFAGSTEQNDYRWGKLHRITLDHPFLPWYSLPADTGVVGQLTGYAVDGGFGVPDASSHSARADSWDEFRFGSGPVRRYAGEAELSIDSRAESIWAGGPSGVPTPGNPFYDSLLPRWLTNHTVRTSLRMSDALQNAYSVTEYVP
jgi:penicillin amidase